MSSFLEKGIRVIDEIIYRSKNESAETKLERRMDCHTLLLMHPQVTWSDIKSHFDTCHLCKIDWSTYDMILNPTITWKEAQEMIEFISGDTVNDWDETDDNDLIASLLNLYSGNSNFHISTLLENLHLPWNRHDICKNKSVTIEHLNSGLLPVSVSMIRVSQNPNITWDIIQEHPQYNWRYHYYSKNPTLQWKNVIEHLELPWDFDAISYHPNVTYADICDNITLPWTYNSMVQNPNIGLDTLFSSTNNSKWFTKRNHPRNKLNCNPNVTWQFIQSNPQIQWNYQFISANPNLTWDIIAKNVDQHWTVRQLCKNPMDLELKNNYRFHSTIMSHEVIPELMSIYFHPKRYSHFVSHGHQEYYL